MKKITLAFALCVFGLLTATAQTIEYTGGVFALNEGGFMAGNASLSFIDSTGVINNDVYAAANEIDSLGDTAQSMAFNDDKAYVVFNGSNAFKVLDGRSLELIATVTDSLSNPRFIGFSGTSAYVTCWGDPTVATDDYVAVFDTEDNSFITKIPVAEGPEKILVVNGRIYVAQKGGYAFGNTVTVIDALTNTVIKTLTVSRVPGSMAVYENFLYVLCEGRPDYSGAETTGSLYKYNLANDEALSSAVLFPGVQHPSNFQVSGSDFYYTMNDGIYRTGPTSPLLPTEPLFTLPVITAEEPVEGEEPVDPTPRGIYGFNIIDEVIYVADNGEYVNPSTVFTYTLDGEPLEEYTAGLLTNSFYKSLEPIPVAGVNDTNALSLKVYPNPAQDVVYISTDKAAAVTIYDLSGRIVKSQVYTSAGINISGLAQGTYLVEMISEKTKMVKKIVKQ